MDDEAPQTVATPSWRKRHPLLARLVLYVLGAGLAALLVALRLDRGAQDSARKLAALARELDDLSLVHAIDPDGSQVLRLLDERFADPGLPVAMRGRALRWRALALRKRSDPEGVERALAAASALDLEPSERTALGLEWAEARLVAGEPDRALEVLPPPGQDPQDPRAILRALLQAQIQVARGDEVDGIAAWLLPWVRALAAPLPAGPEAYVGGRPWSPAQAATVLVEALARLAPDAPEPDPWRLLRRLAPDDVQAQVSAARGLAAQGLAVEARGALDRARALAPALVATEAARDPGLRDLLAAPR